MKLLSVLVLAMSVAAASECKPATYRCERNQRAWDVCDVSGDWVFAGRCPPGTVCLFNKQNGSPYCLPRHIVQGDTQDEEIDEVREQL